MSKIPNHFKGYEYHPEVYSPSRYGQDIRGYRRYIKKPNYKKPNYKKEWSDYFKNSLSPPTKFSKYKKIKSYTKNIYTKNKYKSITGYNNRGYLFSGDFYYRYLGIGDGNGKITLKQMILSFLFISFLIVWIVWESFWKVSDQPKEYFDLNLWNGDDHKTFLENPDQFLLNLVNTKDLGKIEDNELGDIINDSDLKQKIDELSESLTYPQCYVSLWYYFWPIVLFKVQRDIRIDTSGDSIYGSFQDMDKYQNYNKLPLPPNKFLYRPYPKGETATNKAIVRPNFDTMYNIAYLDLSKSPQIIKVPKVPRIPKNIGGGKRYWSVQFLDAWSNTFQMPGSRLENSFGNYYVTGPTWREANHDGQIITTPSSRCWSGIIVTTVLFLLCLLSVFIFSNDTKVVGAGLVGLLLLVLLAVLLFTDKCQHYDEIYESPTDYVWIIVRIQTNGEIDSFNVEKFQKKFKVYSLYSGYEKYVFEKSLSNLVPEELYYDINDTCCDGDLDEFGIPQDGRPRISSSTIVQEKFTSETFWNFAVYMMNQGNPPVKDKYQKRVLDSLLMLPNKELDYIVPKDYYTNTNELNQTILNFLHSTGPGILDINILVWSNRETDFNGYVTPNDLGSYGIDYLLRAIAAGTGFGANPPEEAIYSVGKNLVSASQRVGQVVGLPGATSNTEENQLNGTLCAYKLRFAGINCRSDEKLPPIDAFWSITCYDQDGYAIPNEADIHAVGSVSHPPLKVNDKTGILTVYLTNIAPDESSEMYTNWLPIPSGIFTLTIRYYSPDREIIDGDYMSPVIEIWDDDNHPLCNEEGQFDGSVGSVCKFDLYDNKMPIQEEDDLEIDYSLVCLPTLICAPPESDIPGDPRPSRCQKAARCTQRGGTIRSGCDLPDTCYFVNGDPCTGSRCDDDSKGYCGGTVDKVPETLFCKDLDPATLEYCDSFHQSSELTNWCTKCVTGPEGGDCFHPIFYNNKKYYNETLDNKPALQYIKEQIPGCFPTKNPNSGLWDSRIGNSGNAIRTGMSDLEAAEYCINCSKCDESPCDNDTSPGDFGCTTNTYCLSIGVKNSCKQQLCLNSANRGSCSVANAQSGPTCKAGGDCIDGSQYDVIRACNDHVYKNTVPPSKDIVEEYSNNTLPPLTENKINKIKEKIKIRNNQFLNANPRYSNLVGLIIKEQNL